MRFRRIAAALLLSLVTASAIAAPREDLRPRKPTPPSIAQKIKRFFQSLGDVYISPPRP